MWKPVPRLTVALPVLLFAAVMAVVSGQAQQTIYIGPQVRDGFVDIDSGILDSIKDVVKELRKDKRLRIGERPQDATQRLYIVARRTGPGAGGVAVPVGTLSVFAEVQSRSIDVILKVGEYERAWTAEDRESDTWTHAARRLAKDLFSLAVA